MIPRHSFLMKEMKQMDQEKDNAIQAPTKELKETKNLQQEIW